MAQNKTAALWVTGMIQALLALFIGLKLDGLITWGWTAVLAPVWLPVISLSVLVFLAAIWSMLK